MTLPAISPGPAPAAGTSADPGNGPTPDDALAAQAFAEILLALGVDVPSQGQQVGGELPGATAEDAAPADAAPAGAAPVDAAPDDAAPEDADPAGTMTGGPSAGDGAPPAVAQVAATDLPTGAAAGATPPDLDGAAHAAAEDGPTADRTVGVGRDDATTPAADRTGSAAFRARWQAGAHPGTTGRGAGGPHTAAPSAAAAAHASPGSLVGAQAGAATPTGDTAGAGLPVTATSTSATGAGATGPVGTPAGEIPEAGAVAAPPPDATGAEVTPDADAVTGQGPTVAGASRPSTASALTTAPPPTAGTPAPPANQLATAVAALHRRGDGEYTATLDLHPAELGRVQVEVAIRAGVVHVHVVAEQASTLALLGDQQGELRQALQQGGLDSGEMTFASGQPRDGDGREGTGRPRDGAGPRGAGATDVLHPAQATATTLLTLPTTGLDVRL